MTQQRAPLLLTPPPPRAEEIEELAEQMRLMRQHRANELRQLRREARSADEETAASAAYHLKKLLHEEAFQNRVANPDRRASLEPYRAKAKAFYDDLTARFRGRWYEQITLNNALETVREYDALYESARY